MAERARTAVTARIKDSIRRIGGAHPELGRHLARSVRTGTFCVYEPDQHWGVVRAGQIIFRYADHDEVCTAGDAYYGAPGHLPLLFAGTELVEFSPAGALASRAPMASACPASRAPAGVSDTGLGPPGRSTRRVPVMCSSREICWLTADWV